MKLHNCKVTNFGSYKELEFDFSNVGLGLISGPTGSGKSTFQDIVSWILFGVTPKGGTVDEVRSWQSEEATEGCLDLDIKSLGSISVYRKRGKSNENDLYWTWHNDEVEHIKHRGKDLQDTQKLLNENLGVAEEVYNIATCYNEFSISGQFFRLNKAKRKEVFETIASLEFPKRLGENIKEYKHAIKALLLESEHKLRESQYKHDYNETQIQELHKLIDSYVETKQNKIASLQSKLVIIANNEQVLADYKIIRQRKKVLSSQKFECDKCGQGLKNSELIELMKQESQIIKEITATDKLEANNQAINTKLGELHVETNPYMSQLSAKVKLCPELKNTVEKLTKYVDQLKVDSSSLEQLYRLNIKLRAELLRKAVKSIQNETNRYLETYFDSEIKVTFSVTDNDNIDIVIQKNGHECSYTQLSKGQRGLLKLCFSVSVMKIVANRIGQHFNTLLFDESLDGLDTELKIKAFALFQELSKSHQSILVIDHCNELKEMFDKRYEVELINDHSVIHEQ